MKKEGVLSVVVIMFVILFSIFLSVGVFAACDDSQLIMRISADTNAHGEVYNGLGNYPVEICYNEIFGSAYTYGGITDEHDCLPDGSNRVIGLSAITNAHAEIPSLDNYDIDVCYGDLSCVARSSCNSDEKMVVSLSANTNAHLAKGSDYNVKICCKRGIVVTGDVYWANMADTPINEADNEDSVKMIWKNTGLSDGASVKFEIYEDDIIDDDEIKIGGNAITATVSNGDAVAVWVITKEDIEAGDGVGEGNDFEFYFKAIYQTEEKESAILTIDKTSFENSPPIAKILTPELGSIFSMREKIAFTQASYDVDDEIITTWDFGDAITSTEYDTTHIYMSTGQKNIKLTVKEKDRGGEDTDRTSIVIYDEITDEKYVFANIKKPGWEENIFGRQVDFDATTSFAFSVVSGMVGCLAGPCPDELIGGPQPIEPLEFDWTFDEEPSSWKEKGETGATPTIWFDKTGLHVTKLKVSINPFSETETKFYIIYDEPVCYRPDDNPDNAYWLEGVNGGVNQKNSLYDCYRIDGVDNEGEANPYCCPSGYSCSEVNTDDWNCIETGIEFCLDYGEDECEDDPYNVGEISVEEKEEDDEFCGKNLGSEGASSGCWFEVDDCRCVWDSTEATCGEAWDKIKKCDDPGDDDPPVTEPIGTCIWTTTEITECDDSGNRYIRWTASWNGGGENVEEGCVAGSRQIPCLSIAALGFFSLFNFILVSVFLFLYYYIKRGK